MFGEESIYGQSIVSKDSKGRIFLPSFTKVETTDKLVLVKESDIYSIYKEVDIDKEIAELELKRNNCATEKERKEIELILLKRYLTILKKLKTDKQGRVLIKPIYESEDKVMVVGAKNHVKLISLKNKKA